MTNKIMKKLWDFSWEDAIIRIFSWPHNSALKEKNSCLKIPHKEKERIISLKGNWLQFICDRKFGHMENNDFFTYTCAFVGMCHVFPKKT